MKLDTSEYANKIIPVCAEKPEYNDEFHRYTYKGKVLASVTGLISDQELIDKRWFPKCAGTVDCNCPRCLGTRTHAACEVIDMGEEPNDDPEINGRVAAYKKFKAENSNIKWIHTEELFINPILGYAGRPDRVGVRVGRKVEVIVVDIKSKNYYPSYAVQLAGYANFFTGAKYFKLLSLLLDPNGTYKLRECDNEGEAHATFSSLAMLRQFGILLPKVQMISLHPAGLTIRSDDGEQTFGVGSYEAHEIYKSANNIYLWKQTHLKTDRRQVA